MAIFSQKNKKTKIDFRNYDDELPNRNVPYQLPKSVEGKLIQMLDFLDYTTGSIDLIKTKSGDYVFLEINPVGQFGMVSYPCNYYLEEKIAIHLSTLAYEE
jgi:glutathione synthase/RimK-type ligase-like ATP-grasp enzyme